MFPAAHFKSRSYLKRAGNCRTFNPSKETINMVKCKVSEKRDLRVIVSEKKNYEASIVSPFKSLALKRV